MQVIATLNFKGGVGKTTVTWLLARYLVDRKSKTVLVIDADPQMSLTTAVYIHESGQWEYRFGRHREQSSGLLPVLKQHVAGKLVGSSIDDSLLYQHGGGLYVIPGDEELYWYDLESPPAAELRDFLASFLKACGRKPDFPAFDYCLVDCPPAFNSLSFSVVHGCDVVLVPINPDVFAAKGLQIILRGLRPRLESLPKFIVFMNRAKTFRGGLTKESQRFLNEAALVADSESTANMSVTLLPDFFIPERKGIKDALAGRRLAPDLETYLAELWDRVEHFARGR